MREEYIIKNIMSMVKHSGEKGIYIKDIERKLRLNKNNFKKFNSIMKKLENSLYIYIIKGQVYSIDRNAFLKLPITKLSNNFAFCEDDNHKYYIQGRLLKGAMLGDLCLIKPLNSSGGDTSEGEVVKIIQYAKKNYSGTVVSFASGIGVIPDTMNRFVFKVKFGLEKGAKVGDKVSFTIYKYANSHFDHIAEIVKVFGDSEKASVCCYAILDDNGIKKRFDKETLEESKSIYEKGITKNDIDKRLDLRNQNIFTIDAKESKDLDDAIYIYKTDDCYKLSVHIADVSHYIKRGSVIDNEAFDRATSVYYADSVIPMLPKEISNGICSLSEKEDRLAFSCFMDISFNGKLLGFEFKKTIINSKVKGVYSEINSILDKTCSKDILDKYKDVLGQIDILNELTDILIKRKELKGGLDIISEECKIIVDENKDPIDIVKRIRGKSERIIEECMILANESCATLGRKLDIPFIYRVHEKPKNSKIESLISLLKILNVPIPKNGLQDEDVSQKVFSDILNSVNGTSLSKVVNINVLRTMAKARYDVDPTGHYGLVLKNYSHFTSPIRRYPDLAVHRIMSDVLQGTEIEKIKKKYKKFVVVSSKHSSFKEVSASDCERQCEESYKAQYMRQFIGDTFKGVISGVVGMGVYVELDNTIEGLVRIEDFKDGYYVLQDNIKYVDTIRGDELFIGKEVEVILTNVNVALGQIDFTMK